jgi:hypothetical protein
MSSFGIAPIIENRRSGNFIASYRLKGQAVVKPDNIKQHARPVGGARYNTADLGSVSMWEDERRRAPDDDT